MPMDQKLLQELIGTFQAELEEQSQSMTNALLQLEKGVPDDAERKKILDGIFRSAHNLKGASRGLGITTVGDIAHHLETLFSTIIHQSGDISHDMIDVCLEATDAMLLAAKSFIEKSALPFDLPALLLKLESASQKNIVTEKVIDTPSVKADTPATESMPAVAKHAPVSAESDSVRIQVDKIDRLSSIMEEIQVSKIEMSDHYAELNRLLASLNQQMRVWKRIQSGVLATATQTSHEEAKNISLLNDYLLEMNHDLTKIQHEFNAKSNSLSALANRLQDEISMLRLVPASVLLCTLPRYIRDLGRELHKEVNLEVKGEDVKIDKLVLEGLKDPINHLLRNSLDHGIEDAPTRLAANKPAAGRISITFEDRGSDIVITITDDGGGLDALKIASVAEKRHVASAEELQSMSIADIHELIFKPGFSTKDVVTDISGRGVGLDVVKSNLVGMKGHVSVTSIKGKGTTFVLRVPLTLSSERGLLIKCGDHQFVLPTSHIKRVMMLKPSDLIEVSGGQAILLDDEPVPYCSLADVLAILGASEVYDYLPTVVITNANYSVALLVDKIIGEREIVIKSLQHPLNKIDYVSGATLLDHHQLAIVLNIDDLVTNSLNIKTITRIAPQDDVKIHREKTHILVVDDSITTRTLEKNVLENKSYQVTTAVNGQEAWDLLQKQKFALMITDVNMPIMDGFTLTERVKNSDKLRSMPVIIVTSLGSDAEKARGLEVGADAYVVKSEFESGALLDIVAQLV